MRQVNQAFDEYTRARDRILRARRDVREPPGDMSLGLAFLLQVRLLEAPVCRDPQLRSVVFETGEILSCDEPTDTSR